MTKIARGASDVVGGSALLLCPGPPPVQFSSNLSLILSWISFTYLRPKQLTDITMADTSTCVASYWHPLRSCTYACPRLYTIPPEWI